MNTTSKLLSITCLSIAIALPFASHARDAVQAEGVSDEFVHEAMEERDEHYHVDAPSTKEEAFALLSNTLGNVKEHFSNGELEEVHKDSYALEAVINTLRKTNAANAALIDEFDEAVQIIHYASEQEDEKVINSEIPKLEKVVATILKN